MGLLNHIKHNALFDFFNDFCTKIGLAKCAVLFANGSLYQAFYSYQFEDTIADASISTKDFWNGTLQKFSCNKEGWYSLFGESLNPFYQLFSYNDQNSLNYLHIKRFFDNNLDAIIIVAEKSLQSNIDLDMLNTISKTLINHLTKAYQMIEEKREELIKSNIEIETMDLSKIINYLYKEQN